MTGSAPATLDWDAFTAGFFPGRHKHDHDALVAYGAYRRGEGTPTANVSVADRDVEDGDALEAWEDEGGMVSLTYGR
jgi:hypothetical protein